MGYYCSECGCDLTEGTLVELEKLSCELRDSDSANNEIEDRLTKMTQAECDARTLVNIREKEITTLRAEIEAKDAEIARLNDNVILRENKMDERARRVTTTEAWVKELEDMVADSTRDILLEPVLQKRIELLEDELFKRGAMEDSPCFCCGYNGPGYYQPDTHACAKRHHKLIGGPVEVDSRIVALEQELAEAKKREDSLNFELGEK